MLPIESINILCITNIKASLLLIKRKPLKCHGIKKFLRTFMEMGTGKSKVLIDNIAMLYNAGKINGALIVAPKGVYKNWFD